MDALFSHLCSEYGRWTFEELCAARAEAEKSPFGHGWCPAERRAVLRGLADAVSLDLMDSEWEPLVDALPFNEFTAMLDDAADLYHEGMADAAQAAYL